VSPKKSKKRDLTMATVIQVPRWVAADLRDALDAHAVPQPDTVVALDGDETVSVFTWAADLAQPVQDGIARYIKAAKAGIPFDLYATIEADLTGLRTYYNLASPTAAQTVAALKALIRVVLADLRDG